MGGTHVEIVGASFAGLACAQACAARGLRTVVWERKRDAGEGVRTTGLLVKEAADELDPPLELTRKIHGVRLYGPSLMWVDLEAPGYYFYATDTPELLRSLARRAEGAGADIRWGRAFPGDRVAPMLVGADGPRSHVARTARLGVNRRFLTGVEVELEDVEGVEDRLHVFLDSRLAPGYIGWVVPGVGITQIGLASSRTGRPPLDAFLGRVSTLFDLSSARRVGSRGGLIPVGGRVRPFASSDVVLVGDAAGVVSPLTAGGIHTALGSGRAAGIAIASHLLDSGPAPEAALRGAFPTFGAKRAMRAALDLRPPNALVDRALGSPRFQALAQTVFFHHRGLWSGDAWRALVRAQR
ncbi:MAG: NAD(P)/FAD-dependent oxidoreductase [Actinomycetota bacterium]